MPFTLTMITLRRIQLGATMAIALCSWLTRSQAAIVVASENLSSDNRIGDPPSSGISRSLVVSAPFSSITDITVSLDISNASGDSAWNGDLYAHLSGPSGTLAVLLNQTGVTLGDASGYGDTGFLIDINDGGSNPDVHQYQSSLYSLNESGQLTGTWASDGRGTATVATRTHPLSQFLGENPNGTWTFYIADLANGNMAKLNAWSLTLHGPDPVPEPVSMGTVVAGLLAAAALHRRRRHSHTI